MVAAVVIGALGVPWKRLKDWLKKLDVKSSIELLQNFCSILDVRSASAISSHGTDINM